MDKTATPGAPGGVLVWGAELALIGVACIWGLTFVMVKDAIAEIPVMTFLAYRFGAAALLVTPIFWRSIRGLGRAGLEAGLLMGVFLTAGYVFQTLGLARTSAANAGFITGMFVVLTPLLGAALGHRADTRSWVAAGVATLGLWLLSGGKQGTSLIGDGLVFICAVAFAAHILATARATRDHPAGALLAVQVGLCAAVTFVFAAAGRDLVAPPDADVWIALAVTAIGATALAFFVQTFAQRHASPARTALILASEPAFAGAFAYLLADERLSAAGWAGAALITAAILWVEVVARPPVPRPQPEG